MSPSPSQAGALEASQQPQRLLNRDQRRKARQWMFWTVAAVLMLWVLIGMRKRR